jgi:hypothetical protein
LEKELEDLAQEELDEALIHVEAPTLPDVPTTDMPAAAKPGEYSGGGHIFKVFWYRGAQV